MGQRHKGESNKLNLTACVRAVRLEESQSVEDGQRFITTNAYLWCINAYSKSRCMNKNNCIMGSPGSGLPDT